MAEVGRADVEGPALADEGEVVDEELPRPRGREEKRLDARRPEAGFDFGGGDFPPPPGAGLDVDPGCGPARAGLEGRLEPADDLAGVAHAEGELLRSGDVEGSPEPHARGARREDQSTGATELGRVVGRRLERGEAEAFHSEPRLEVPLLEPGDRRPPALDAEVEAGPAEPVEPADEERAIEPRLPLEDPDRGGIVETVGPVPVEGGPPAARAEGEAEEGDREEEGRRPR